MKKKIIIISGEPESINSEIIFKSWKKISKKLKKKIYLISNYELLVNQFKLLKYKIKIKKVKNIYQNDDGEFLKVLDLDFNFKNLSLFKKKDVNKFINKSLNLGHEMALKNDVKGIINCPINKIHLNKKFYGATEFFASKCSIKNNSEVMLINTKKMSVSPITTHINIKNVSKEITKNIIINKIKTIDFYFKSLFKKKPRIALLGLNPHNSEFKKNSEENKIIIPALNKVKNIGVNISGPFAADTIFANNYKKFDVIVGMYHDQVLAPFKALFKFKAINITLGLKYLRISPDHGTASDIIGKNKANPESLLNCIHFIDKYGK